MMKATVERTPKILRDFEKMMKTTLLGAKGIATRNKDATRD